MYMASLLRIVAEKLSKCKVDLVRVQEVRWDLCILKILEK
jgi:hypothetical protein